MRDEQLNWSGIKLAKNLDLVYILKSYNLLFKFFPIFQKSGQKSLNISYQ
jgi:hypothetical protein